MYIYIWLLVWNMAGFWLSIYWEESSQRTLSSFIHHQPAIPHETTTPGVADDGQPHLRWERHRHDAIQSRRTAKASTNGAQPQQTSLLRVGLMGWVSLWTVENIDVQWCSWFLGMSEIWLKYLHVKTDWVGRPLDVQLEVLLDPHRPRPKTAVRVAVGRTMAHQVRSHVMKSLGC